MRLVGKRPYESLTFFLSWAKLSDKKETRLRFQLHFTLYVVVWQYVVEGAKRWDIDGDLDKCQPSYILENGKYLKQEMMGISIDFIAKQARICGYKKGGKHPKKRRTRPKRIQNGSGKRRAGTVQAVLLCISGASGIHFFEDVNRIAQIKIRRAGGKAIHDRFLHRIPSWAWKTGCRCIHGRHRNLLCCLDPNV